jgi:hypothetical protein
MVAASASGVGESAVIEGIWKRKERVSVVLVGALVKPLDECEQCCVCTYSDLIF